MQTQLPLVLFGWEKRPPCVFWSGARHWLRSTQGANSGSYLASLPRILFEDRLVANRRVQPVHISRQAGIFYPKLC